MDNEGKAPLITYEPRNTSNESSNYSEKSNDVLEIEAGRDSQEDLRVGGVVLSGARGVPLPVTLFLFVPLLACSFFAANASDEGHGGTHPWFVAVVSNCSKKEYEALAHHSNCHQHPQQVFFYYDRAIQAMFDPVKKDWVPNMSNTVYYEECVNEESLSPPATRSLQSEPKYTLGGSTWQKMKQRGPLIEILSNTSFGFSIVALILSIFRVLKLKSPQCQTLSAVLGNSFAKNVAGVWKHGALVLVLGAAAIQYAAVLSLTDPIFNFDLNCNFGGCGAWPNSTYSPSRCEKFTDKQPGDCARRLFGNASYCDSSVCGSISVLSTSSSSSGDINFGDFLWPTYEKKPRLCTQINIGWGMAAKWTVFGFYFAALLTIGTVYSVSTVLPLLTASTSPLFSR
jgi:hypothetical protein